MDWFGCAPSAAVCWLPDGASLTVPLRQRGRVVRAPGQMRGWCLAQGITTISDLAEWAGISDELAMRLFDADPRFGRLDSTRGPFRTHLHDQPGYEVDGGTARATAESPARDPRRRPR